MVAVRIKDCDRFRMGRFTLHTNTNIAPALPGPGRQRQTTSLVHYSANTWRCQTTVKAASRAFPAGRALPLRPVLGLFHGDLVDVRERFRPACAFNRFHSDILDLLLGVGKLFL